MSGTGASFTVPKKNDHLKDHEIVHQAVKNVLHKQCKNTKNSMFIIYPSIDSDRRQEFFYQEWAEQVRQKLNQDSIRSVPIAMKEFQDIFKK